MLKVACIGLGNRVSTLLKQLNEIDAEFELTGVVDPSPQFVEPRLTRYDIGISKIKYYPTPQALLENADQFDGVVIGTRCDLHTPMAIEVAKTNLPLFLEKPVGISTEQVAALAKAFKGREKQVVVSFPLRVTPLFKAVHEIILSGRLGTINQIQAFNDVTYGGVYFGQWHRNYEESGGLWLQKATHDLDYVNCLAGAYPTMIAAMTSRLVFGGDKPHDLKCAQCDEQDTCVESTKNQLARNDQSMLAPTRVDMPDDHWCAFSKDIKNQDAGAAIVRYANGIHANYTQNFVARRDAARRGARIIGHQATLEFDWYTHQIRVINHHGDERVDEIKIKSTSSHMGGDGVLARNFIDLMRGKDESQTDLTDGILSATMCLAARKSGEDQTFEKIQMP